MTRAVAGLCSRPGVALAALLLAADWTTSSEARPQTPPPDLPITAAEDSLRVLAAVRARQADFERIRRRYLPEGRSSSGGRCDERIGRFCLTHDGDGIDWRIPVEREQIRTARAELIADLQEALGRIPEDAWINGQLIRYLVEARRHQEAIQAALECRAATWWCNALQGFAYHESARPGEAERAFDAALLQMDEGERAGWEDLSLLLPGRITAAWRGLPSADRLRSEQRFWALADPFFTRPGNELRSEHLARHVRGRLLRESASPEGGAWRPDQQEVLIRYGWPLGWERSQPVAGQSNSPPLIAHLGTSPFFPLPPVEALLATVPVGEWDTPVRAPRAEYEIPLLDSIATWIFPLDHQFAVFHRDGTPLLVAAYALPADVIPADVDVQSALGIVSFDRPEIRRDAERRESTGRRGAHLVPLPRDSAVVASLELILPDSRHIARAREFVPAHPAPTGPHLSDLLLIDPGAVLPDSLTEALLSARGSTDVAAGEEIGIFWELYGVTGETPQSIRMTLLFAPTRSGGILRRLAQSVGLAERSSPVRLEWEEEVSRAGRLARSMTLRIPPRAAGDFVMELTARMEDGTQVSTKRELRVIRP